MFQIYVHCRWHFVECGKDSEDNALASTVHSSFSACGPIQDVVLIMEVKKGANYWTYMRSTTYEVLPKSSRNSSATA